MTMQVGAKWYNKRLRLVASEDITGSISMHMLQQRRNFENQLTDNKGLKLLISSKFNRFHLLQALIITKDF